MGLVNEGISMMIEKMIKKYRNRVENKKKSEYVPENVIKEVLKREMGRDLYKLETVKLLITRLDEYIDVSKPFKKIEAKIWGFLKIAGIPVGAYLATVYAANLLKENQSPVASAIVLLACIGAVYLMWWVTTYCLTYQSSRNKDYVYALEIREALINSEIMLQAEKEN